MKGAAKCDKHCDLQNSVNQQGFERILRFRDTPESMPASVSTSVSCLWWIPQLSGWESVCQMLVSVHQGVLPLMHSEYSAAVGEQPTERLTVVSCCLAFGGLSVVPRALVLGSCRFLDMKLGQQTR